MRTTFSEKLGENSMANLLNAEFYKLRHKRSFWVTLLIAVFLENILLMDGLLRTSVLWQASLYNAPQLYFLLIIFGALFIGDEFENRTFQSLISAGHSRGQILFAKTAAYMTACVLLVMTPLLLHVLTAGYLPEFWPNIPLIFTAILAMGMLPLLAAVILKDVGKAMAIPLAFYMAMVFVLNGRHNTLASQLLPVGHLRLIALNGLTDSWGILLGIDVAWILILYIAAHFWFCRSDLK